MEIASALSEKSSEFRPRDIATLSSLIDSFNREKPVPQTTDLTMGIHTLERDAFDLLMKQLVYDSKAWDVFFAKIGDYEAAVTHTKQTWKQKAKEASKNAAQSFFDTNCKLVCYDKPELLFQAWADFKDFVERKHQLGKTKSATL